MKVSVYDPFVNEKEISSLGGKKVDNIYESIKVMDYVSIHVPLTSQSKNLINMKVLNTMKKNHSIYIVLIFLLYYR